MSDEKSAMSDDKPVTSAASSASGPAQSPSRIDTAETADAAQDAGALPASEAPRADTAESGEPAETWNRAPAVARRKASKVRGVGLIVMFSIIALAFLLAFLDNESREQVRWMEGPAKDRPMQPIFVGR